MKAIFYSKYGAPDQLQLKEVEKPTPGDNEVLVEIHAATVTVGDVYTIKGEPFLTRFWTGLLEPKDRIPAKEMAGRVEAVGENVTQFKPGDEVFGDLSGCSLGALAEYVAVPEDAIALKPANLTFEEAAAVPEWVLVALQGLRDKGKIQAGQMVLINGASGGVGTFAVQIAKSFGADVTAVCSTKNMDSMGADRVIDYMQEDFTQNGKRYDPILAANGYHPIADYRRTLNPEGFYVATGGTMAQIFQAMMLGPIISMTGRKTMGNMLVKPNKHDLLLTKVVSHFDLLGSWWYFYLRSSGDNLHFFVNEQSDRWLGFERVSPSRRRIRSGGQAASYLTNPHTTPAPLCPPRVAGHPLSPYPPTGLPPHHPRRILNCHPVGASATGKGEKDAIHP